MQYVYPCNFAPEEDGSFNVSFPDIPEALTCGNDRVEALAMAEDALTVALGTYVDNSQNIPVPSVAVAGQELIAVPAMAAAKLALYTAMRHQNISSVALAKCLDVSEVAIRKLLDLDHRSHMDSVERALHAVGRGLVVGDRVAA